MKQEELNLILKNHRKWLNDEDCGIRANLRGANLRGANLREANLCGANLCGANLREANLCGATGNQREIITLQTNLWQIVYTKDVMQIGCQRHNINDWFGFSDDRIAEMDRKALGFWEKWKPILLMVMEIDSNPKKP